MNPQRIIPPVMIHGFEDWAGVGVVLGLHNTRKNIIVCSLITTGLQVYIDLGSCGPLFKTKICLKVMVGDALGADKI